MSGWRGAADAPRQAVQQPWYAADVTEAAGGAAAHLLFRCRSQYDLVLIALGNVHEVDDFFYRHCTVSVDREGGVVGIPQQELEGRFYICEGYGLGISVDVVGVGSELWVVLDGYADGGLGGDLVGALGQQESEGVGVDQGRG